MYKKNFKVQFWNRFSLLPKSWLCTNAKQKYGDGYGGEGKRGFITLLGKGGTQYASASRTVPPSLPSREMLNSHFLLWIKFNTIVHSCCGGNNFNIIWLLFSIDSWHKHKSTIQKETLTFVTVLNKCGKRTNF